MKKLKLLASLLAMMAFGNAFAEDSNPGFNLSKQKIYVASQGEVKLTFVSQSASFSNDLFLNSEVTKILNSKTNTPGEIFSLGSFGEGAELIFKLFSNNTGKSYFNGPENRNADGVIHAKYKYGEDKQLYIGFEDLWKGGDKDYNDLVFSLSNVYLADGVLQPVPEPASYVLMGLGLLGMGWVRNRRFKG